MKHFLPCQVARTFSTPSLILLLVSLALFTAKNSFAQADHVNPGSASLKPDNPRDDCSMCTCICIQASVDFANIHESYGPGAGVYSGYKSKVGFNLGVFAMKPIKELGPGAIGARGGIEFIQKGGKYSSGSDLEDYRMNYIEIPFDAFYQYSIKNAGIVFAGLGPYFAYGVGGKIKYGDGEPSDNAFGGQYGAKRFDFGLQFIGGFRLSCMASVILAYDLGLTNISGSNYSDRFKDKNGAFSINLAFCLGGLKRK
ncbi:MAG: PorT family protein [Bacteroidetes bacterium]|nr:PorT family protein [Bacteroidota bacterium]MBS1974762.1 PorT family protein [Bacteroidota bacterium]